MVHQLSFEDSESKKKDEEEEEGKPDQLTQLVTTFSRKATTENSGIESDDVLYMSYAEIMAKSCGEEEEEGGDEEEGGGEEEDAGAEDPTAALNVSIFSIIVFSNLWDMEDTQKITFSNINYTFILLFFY